MSVDTRTPRSGFDEQPPLSMLKVDSDPAQVIVNHASFRVKLATPSRPAPRRAAAQRAAAAGAGVADTARIPAVRDANTARRRAPVVWSGRSQPGDPAASGLLQAVRDSGAGTTALATPAVRGYDNGAYDTGSYDTGAYDAGATQVIPRVGVDQDATVQAPAAGGGRGPDAPLLPPMRQAVGAYDTPPRGAGYGDGDSDTYEGEAYADDPYDTSYGREDAYDLTPDDDDPEQTGARSRARAAAAEAAVRHAYFPGRRMNLGVVLLPLRVFLGLISVYAGMGKLCDPVYFDGGERGSMVKWLTSLHPWALAEPLRDFALAHPVGAGLSVAFLQIVAGVLTVLGLWQRVAASLGALLSAALLVTVSWKTVPAYDAPDIIYLAAWSPLIIAGAPVYSVDGKLAGDAWRKLGPRSSLLDLRRYVLRRGSVVASIVIGVTLLVGSVLGGAVRSSGVVTVPGPNHDPVNQLPGEPLPQNSASRTSAGTPGARAQGEDGTPTGEPSAGHSHTPTAGTQSAPGTPGASSGTGGGAGSSGTQGGAPTQSQGGGGQATSGTTEQQAPPAVGSQNVAPSTSGSASAGSSSSSSGGTSSSGGAESGDTSGGSSSSSSGGNPIGGLLG
ncbi:DoxX family protein [Streptomyces tremellae]|uniref:DoxX family membrane protein n=1 Tax=Streptomyces tremellae TaxID=1124239 RepID=A0ABP7F4R3_9ACTN